MQLPYLLVIFITLVVGSVFLFIWQRRDRGVAPVDRLAETIHDGRSPN